MKPCRLNVGRSFTFITTIGNFASLFRHKRVLSYMLASGFSFAGMFSFLSAGPFVYIEINHVLPQHFGYYFALNIVFLFVMTIINSRFVRRAGAINMFRAGLWIQFVMAIWMVLTAFFDVGFGRWSWALLHLLAAYRWSLRMRWRSSLMSSLIWLAPLPRWRVRSALASGPSSGRCYP